MEIVKINPENEERVFVFGDLHGCLAEPALLVEHLVNNEGLCKEDYVVFLGDYIDRGLESRELIDFLIGLRHKFPRTIFLQGNHEAMLTDYLSGTGRFGPSFLFNGGVETLLSYQISPTISPKEIQSSIPAEHMEFLSWLELGAEMKDFFLVHAGLDPRKAVAEQSDAEMCWIRDEFIYFNHSFNKVVVFGHTPFRDVFFDLPYKIGIDTGLVFGNKLSCLELTKGCVYQIKRGAKKVKVRRQKMMGQIFEAS